MTTRSAFTASNDLEELLQNFERKAPVQLGSDSTEECSNRAGSSTLFADDLTQVTFRHAQFEHGRMLSGNLVYYHSSGRIHQRLGNLFHKRFHAVTVIHFLPLTACLAWQAHVS